MQEAEWGLKCENREDSRAVNCGVGAGWAWPDGNQDEPMNGTIVLVQEGSGDDAASCPHTDPPVQYKPNENLNRNSYTYREKEHIYYEAIVIKAIVDGIKLHQLANVRVKSTETAPHIYRA